MKTFKSILKKTLPILMIIGPGIISGSVDNDAGGIATYSVAGANFGYSLLWVLFLTTFALALTQEIGARLGLVTGKGLAALIREKFGIKWTTFIMAVLLIANLGTIAAEFAGIAAALQIINIPKFISIPVAILAVYLIIIKGSFKKLEKIFLMLSAFYIVYIISAFMAKPDWLLGAKSLIMPTFSISKGYFLALIATVGTTITPWGQFFIQDYVVDKKLTQSDLKVERGDVFVGSFLTNFISFFIIVACAATIYATHQSITDAAGAAQALRPLAGNFAALLFSFGLLNASLFGAALVPISTSYVLTEAFGFESGLDFSFKEAPAFYGIFTLLLIICGIFVLLPIFPLLTILIVSQAFNAILLVPILFFIFILSNDKKLLGEYKNSRFVNIILIITLSLLAITSLIYLGTLFWG